MENKGSIVVFTFLILLHLSNESDEGNGDISGEGDDDKSLQVIRHTIYINQNTSIMTTRITNDENVILVDTLTNNGNRQMMYLNKKQKEVVVLPSTNPRMCLLYRTADLFQGTHYDKPNTVPHKLIASKVKKCLYKVLNAWNIGNEHVKQLCGNRQIQKLALITCGSVTTNDVTLSKRQGRTKRAPCYKVWETYRVETTCLTTLFYNIMQKTCVTHNEYFSKYLCLVESELSTQSIR